MLLLLLVPQQPGRCCSVVRSCFCSGESREAAWCGWGLLEGPLETPLFWSCSGSPRVSEIQVGQSGPQLGQHRECAALALTQRQQLVLSPLLFELGVLGSVCHQ